MKTRAANEQFQKDLSITREKDFKKKQTSVNAIKKGNSSRLPSVEQNHRFINFENTAEIQ